MQEPARTGVVSGEVSVDYSAFGLQDAQDGPTEPWTSLGPPEPPKWILVGIGCCAIRSSEHRHTAKVVLRENFPDPVPVGWEEIASDHYRTLSGLVQVWTLMSGPTDVVLKLKPRRRYTLKVYRKTTATAPQGTYAEEYIFAFAGA